MAKILPNRFVNDLIDRQAIGVSIPFSNSGVFHQTYTTADQIKSNGVKIARYRPAETKIKYGHHTVGAHITGSYLTLGSGSSAFHVTASGNISASGIVIADTFQSTGGSVDGISFTDDLNITGKSSIPILINTSVIPPPAASISNVNDKYSAPLI